MKKQPPLVKYDIESIEKAFRTISNYSLLGIDIECLHQFSSKEKHILERLKDIYFKIKLLKDYEVVELEHF